MPPLSPRAVYLELTGNCNLRCRYCYNRSGSSGDFPVERLPGLLREMRELEIGELIFSGGEPLLYPDLKAVLSFAAPLFRVSLVSNGTLIDREWAGLLAALPALKLEISLEGVSPEVNDPLRGEGSWKLTRRGIENLLEAGLAERITLCFTLNRYNFKHFKAITDRARRWGIERILLSPPVKLGRAAEVWEELALSREEKIAAYREISALKGPELEIFGLFPEQLQRFKEEGGKTAACPLGEKLHISSAGEVYPCSQLNRAEFSLGNVERQSLKEIIGAGFPARLQTLPEKRCREIALCRECAFLSICQGGCPGEALNQTGDLYHPDPNCEVIKYFLAQYLA